MGGGIILTVYALIASVIAGPTWAGQSINANSNGVSVRSDAKTYLACSGGIAYVFEAGSFAAISPDETGVPVCVDYRDGHLHNFSGGSQAAECREQVKTDVDLCAGPYACGETLTPIDLGSCW
ncbi:MAG: hypothetical protein ACE363_05965 [Alphaproteobacteria bacterium]